MAVVLEMLNAQSSDLGKLLKNVVKNLPTDAGSPRDKGPGLGRSPGGEMATCSSILTWRIP